MKCLRASFPPLLLDSVLRVACCVKWSADFSQLLDATRQTQHVPFEDEGESATATVSRLATLSVPPIPPPDTSRFPRASDDNAAGRPMPQRSCASPSRRQSRGST